MAPDRTIFLRFVDFLASRDTNGDLMLLVCCYQFMNCLRPLMPHMWRNVRFKGWVVRKLYRRHAGTEWSRRPAVGDSDGGPGGRDDSGSLCHPWAAPGGPPVALRWPPGGHCAVLGPAAGDSGAGDDAMPPRGAQIFLRAVPGQRATRWRGPGRAVKRRACGGVENTRTRGDGKNAEGSGTTEGGGNAGRPAGGMGDMKAAKTATPRVSVPGTNTRGVRNLFGRSSPSSRRSAWNAGSRPRR